MTWLLKFNGSLVAGDYLIRTIRGELVAFFKTQMLGRFETSETLTAKELCRVHFWRKAS